MEKLVKTEGEKSSLHKLLNHKFSPKELIFLFALIVCLLPFISAPIALLIGIILAQFIGQPYPKLQQKATHFLLQVSVVGLGFGMQISSALKVGKDGIAFTVVSIVGILILGYFLGKLLKIEKKTSYLIAAGTAICGGSAIAAISPVIRASEKPISVALGTIFILNALALWIFPWLGNLLHLSQSQFGIWCALAIHDTSSVVGAAGVYGTEALEIATTVKLARALWIIPLAFISTFIFKNKGAKVKIPYFIGLFVLAMVANSYIPFVQAYHHYAVALAKTGLTVTLFLIGCGLNFKVLKTVGFKPLVQGVLLWVVMAVATLWTILYIG